MATELSWGSKVPPVDPTNNGLNWGRPIINPDTIRRHPVEVAAALQWPATANAGVQFTYNPNNSGNMLEYWPKGETGDSSYPRPGNIPIARNGIDINSSQTRPSDIAGDITSHQLVQTDPVIKNMYHQFNKSLTPEQEQFMGRQYAESGDERPYEQWRETAGLPAYFRGYAFDQWGPDSKQFYTPEQLQMFDGMKTYLKKPPKKK